MRQNIFRPTAQCSEEEASYREGTFLSRADWLSVNSITKISNDWAQAQLERLKVEAQLHENKRFAVVWFKKQRIYISTVDLRCHWKHFMYPADSSELLYAATAWIPPTPRLTCLCILLHSHFCHKAELSQERTEGRFSVTFEFIHWSKWAKWFFLNVVSLILLDE